MEQGVLRFRAPKGALTAELRAIVQARSAELVAHLSAATAAPDQIPPIDRAGDLRMSFGQERIWFLHRLEGPSSTYNITPVFRLRGPLSMPALQAAFDTLVERHEPLRTRCAEIDGLGVQIVEPPAPVPVTIVSLDQLPAEQRLAAAEKLILEETARPFDLEREHPLRVTLIELDDEDRVLLPFMHHIAADGWSLGVLQQEFNVLYHAAVTGRTPELARLPVQYADFAAWQRAIQEGERGRAGLDYWRAQLAGAPQTLALPLDFERPPALTSSGQVLHLSIAEATAEAIAARARAEGSSLFMILLAAYAVLLHRYSGQDDILIGSPVAGRPRRELEALIGCFVNTLVLRVRVTGSETFTALLKQVRQTSLDGFSWQDTPVEAVIDAVIEQRDPSRIPLYQAQFSLQNVPVRASAVSSLQVEPMPMDRVAAKNDLSFILERREGAGIGVEVEFNTDLFREETTRGMWDDYLEILQHAVASPETVVSSLRMRSVPSVAAPPVHANDGPQDLVAWFGATAADHATRVAVKDAANELTYAQLDRRAGAIAAALLARNTAPQSPVGVLMSRSVDLPAAIIGVLKAGGAYVPLSSDHPADRLRFMLTHAGVRLLVVDDTTETAARELIAGTDIGLVVVSAAMFAEPTGNPKEGVASTSPGDLAYIIFTSGSTGRPKGVMIEHRSVVNLVHALRDLVYADLPGALNVALVASPVFDASVQQIFATLLLGHTLCLVPEDLRRDGERLCAWFRDRRIDVSDGTPSLLGLMVRGGLAAQCGATLRHLLIGGEPLPTDLLRALYRDPAGHGIVVTNVYGPTECCVDVVAQRITSQDALTGATMAIGHPMRNCEAVIVDRHGRVVPIGVPGELIIAGICVGRGYVNDPALTAERFVSWPLASKTPGSQDPKPSSGRAYRTGDVCRQTRAGVIEFLGRNDDQVKILGHRIELGEVESHLRAHPAIAEVSVQARLTSKGYREMAAYAVTRAPLSVTELREFAAARMPAYMIPAYFVPLDALPLNESGKVARDRLPDPETARLMPSGAEYVAPASAAEEALLQVWTRTLKLERAGVRDNYFASGGDSIKALQLASRLRDAGWKVEIRDIFKYPTIEQLSPHLTTWPGAAAVDHGPDTGAAPLSATGRFFFDAYGEGATFNQAILLRPRKPLTVDRLRAALALLMTQHGMLRSRFVREHGEWRQETLAPGTVTPEIFTARVPAAQSFALDRAPLWSAALYGEADGQRLLLTAHHLIVDGVSWRILIDDLQLVLGQLDRGETPLLPARSAPYAAWVAHQRHALATTLPAEREYWSPGRHAATVNEPPSQQRDRREVRAVLSADLTRALLTEAHGAYATEINDLLIAAVARAWGQWTGSDRCGLTVEGHGREALAGEIDTTRTIGWFTSIFPVTIELSQSATAGAAIEAAKATLRAIPHKGAGYTVLSYLGEDDRGRLAPLPPLAFNYLGRFDSAGEEWFERAPEEPPPTVTPDVAMPWPLEITAAVVSDRMEMTLAYSASRYESSAVEAFFTEVQFQIDAVVRHALEHGASPIQESLSLTPLQDGMYFHAVSEPDSDAYFEQWSFRLEGQVQPELVQSAWNELFARHDALRAVFTADASGRPVQQIQRHREVEFRIKDLSTTAPSERDARLAMEKDADRRLGFMLAARPLVRVILIRWAADAWDLIWSHHHIILDGWSAGLLQYEFLETYAARVAGRAPTLEPAPAFGSFVRSLPAATDAAFWRDYLDGYDTTAELPRSAQVESGLGRHLLELSPVTTERIAAFCRSEGVTLSAFVQAVWGVILSRYAYSDDVVFGYVVSGRPPGLPGVERMVGLLINTIPVRIRLREDEPFRALVKRLLGEAADLTAHQHAPLVDVQRASGASAPLINHVVALENYPLEDGLRAFGRKELGFDITAAASYDRTNYGFDLVVLPGADALRFRLSWDRSMHADALMARIGEQLRCVIEAAVANPDQSPCAINILPPEQRDAIVALPNLTSAAYPSTRTIVDLFDACVSRHPDAPAVLAPHRSEQWLTYGQLQTRARAVAASLHHDLRVPPGSRVGVYLRPSVEAVVAVLGVLQAGCTYVPVDPRYPQERVQFILADSGVKAVLAADEDIAALPPLACPVVDIDSLPAEDARSVPRSATPDDVAYVIYTSGSTGVPKGCLVSHRNVVRLIVNDRFDFDFGPSDVWVMAHALSFDFSVWEMYGALLLGGRLVLPPRDVVQDVSLFRDLLAKYRVTVLNQTPLAFYNLVAVEEASPDHTLGDHLRYVIFGGDRLDTNRLQAWIRHYPAEAVALVNMYGITETTVHVTYCRLTQEQILAPGGLSPVGRPLPETTVYVCDRHLNPQPLGAPGEMLVGGSGVCLGYLDRPELTAARFIPDAFGGSGRLYRSGDLAFRDESGGLNFVGRNDHQVKIRGHRIEPAEVERALRAIAGVTQAAVIVEQGPAGNELLACVVGGVEADAVRGALEATLPDYLVPGGIVVAEALPLTAHGKLDVAAVRALKIQQTSASAATFEAPVGEHEQLLAGIWAEVIGVERVGRHDRFISLGGDSIKSIQILARLRARGLTLDLKELFRYPTVAELAPRLQTRRAQASIETAGPFALTPIQRRFFEEHTVEASHYNHAVLLRFEGEADLPRLRDALQQLQDAHAGLRQRFNRTDSSFAPAGEAVMFTVEDLRGESDPLAAMKELSAREQTGFSLEPGPLFRAAVYRLPDADRLLLVAHHLVVDGVTWQFLLEDLATALGGQPLPERTDSFAAWSAALQELAAAPSVAAELPYWQQVDAEAAPAAALPADTGRYADATEELIEWDAAATADLLRRASAAYQTNAGELLLTAVARALGRWTGEPRVQVALEGHGRDAAPAVDTSRTAGWFTALYPFVLDLQDHPIGRRIRQMKEDLRQVPNGGAGYGILRYLSSLPDAARLRARPRISFNYLGEFRTGTASGPFSLCHDPIAPAASPAGPRPFALEIAAIVVGGRLRLSLIYSATHLEPSRVRELRNVLDEELRLVVEHCMNRDVPELTPADLTHKGISLDELDELFDDD